MKEKLYESIKVAAYFLWEFLQHDNALSILYCSEDIAHIFQVNGITSHERLNELVSLEKDNYIYINFVRTIAYRIYFYTGNEDDFENWFVTEKLLCHFEWADAVITVSNIYDNIKNDKELIKGIRLDPVRAFYKNKM